MTVLITLTTAGADTGPFNLFSDANEYTSAFAVGVSKLDLEAGYPSNVVPDETTTIKVQSVNSLCNNFILLPTGITTTTTTTVFSNSYFVSSGTPACVGGYVNISNVVNITVYSNKLLEDLVIGDSLYSDPGLTTLITSTYIRTTTSGTIGTLYLTISVPGIIDTIETPSTPC